MEKELLVRTRDMQFGVDQVKHVNCYEWARLAERNGLDVNWCMGWIVQGFPEPPRWLF